MTNTKITTRICQIIQREPLRMQPLQGGKISQVMRVDFADGDALVAKFGDGGHDLTIEAYMLDTLRERSELPVPNVLHAEPDLLLMEYVAGADDLTPDSVRQLGTMLAQCHQAARYSLRTRARYAHWTAASTQSAYKIVDNILPRQPTPVHDWHCAGIWRIATGA